MRTIFLTACLAGALTACATQQDPEPPAAGARVETWVYECDNYTFTARFAGDAMTVWLDDGRRELDRARSGSGMRYTDGVVEFFGKGKEGMLTIADARYPNCRALEEEGPWEEARRRGVSFRAVGNEPGWHLELQPGRHILFVSDYGAQRVTTPWVKPEVSGATTVYRALTESSELQVEVVAQPCADTMADVSYPDTVAVTLNGRSYHGCGRALDHPW